MKCVRLVRKDEDAVSPVIATILMVAITVVLAAVLYVMVSAFLIGPPPITTMGVSIRQRGENWSVEVIQTPTNAVPSSTYLSISDANGVLKLVRTPWSSLSAANWNTYHAAYEDANPSNPAIATGDSLLISSAAYAAGCTVTISSESSQLATGRLQ